MEIICPICQERMDEEELKNGKCPMCGYDFSQDGNDEVSDEESTFMFDQAGLPLWGGL